MSAALDPAPDAKSPAAAPAADKTGRPADPHLVIETALGGPNPAARAAALRVVLALDVAGWSFTHPKLPGVRVRYAERASDAEGSD